MKREQRDRLAGLHIEIDEAVESRHLDAVAQELRHPSATVRFKPARRIKVATLVAGAILMVLPAAALAAEDAVPGDLLYPIKRATERVWLIVDPNIDAKHRIEELETVVDREAPADEVGDRLTDAEQTVRNRDVPTDLLDRLDTVRDRVSTDDNDDTPQEPETTDSRDGSATDRVTTTTTPPTTTSSLPPRDRPEPTTTTSTTEPPPSTDRPPRDATTTTTHPPSDREDPPSDRQG